MPITGRITFDYSSNSGVRTIGHGDALFATQWSRSGGGSIYAYNDQPSVEAIAIATDAAEITDVRDAARFDYSSRSRQLTDGQILLLRNNHGHYAAIKILSLQAGGSYGRIDELSFRFVILPNGGRDFSGVQNMEVSDASFTKRVLFVGAGFSRNWGGLLASEVGGRILGHPAVQTRPRLRTLLLENSSFEDALEKTRTGLFEEADANAMTASIRTVFDEMDVHYKNPTPPVLPATINNFLSRFCPGAVGVGTGYVFSLNQDLLFERIYGTIPDRQKLTIPGVTWSGAVPTFPAGAETIPMALVSDPSGGNEPVLLRNFNLIKLHGSINWSSTTGAPTMVMGRRKRNTISNSPLLEWYHRVFESVVSAGDVRLMVIGYGWGDDHINEIIGTAVRERNLQIYTWGPSRPQDALQGRFMGGDILSGVMGYETRPLTEVMPHTPLNPRNADYEAVVDRFF